MDFQKCLIIHERNKGKYIPQKFIKSNDILIIKNEYCLNQNIFDPSESSPPNEFMLKLYLRMCKYQKKEDNLLTE
jgi:hypothetical protein